MDIRTDGQRDRQIALAAKRVEGDRSVSDRSGMLSCWKRLSSSEESATARPDLQRRYLFTAQRLHSATSKAEARPKHNNAEREPPFIRRRLCS